MDEEPEGTVIINETTPLQVTIRLSDNRWNEIIEKKHPILQGKLDLVKRALTSPVEIRRSRTDHAVHLYYAKEPGTPYHVCVVARHIYPDGFIITAYRTDRIKEGERVWTL